MSLSSFWFKILATLSDKKRDKDLEVDPTQKTHYDIKYGKSDKYNSLDIYYPKQTTEKRPVIINFHGGGFVYGTKENYLHYGLFMAKQGFVFVNSNYHLAPEYKFPTQLEELNSVVEWVTDHHENYHMDLSNVFIVGDSVGAQLALQYAAIYTNERFAELFDFSVPEEFTLRALALNCGLYDIYTKMKAPQKKNKKDPKSQLLSLLKDYLGENWEEYQKQLSAAEYINDTFPPTFLMTAEYDFLRGESLPLLDILTKNEVEVTYKKYGKPGDKHLAHIFQCDMNLVEAEMCNKEQADFFKSKMIL